MLQRLSCISILHLISLATATIAASSVAQAAPHKGNKLLVVIDPGHGGEDTGAIAKLGGEEVFEKDITLAIAIQTMRHLKARGIAAELTRSDDRFLALDKRAEMANKSAKRTQSAVFVSIHANSSDDTRSTGAESYVFNAATNEASRRLADLENGKRWTTSHSALELIMADLASTANYADSVNLACNIQNSVVDGMSRSRFPVRNRGIRQALFYVLMQTQMPGILFEPGFMSNLSDLARLADPNYQSALARSLADGIIKWRAKSLATRQSRGVKRAVAMSALQKSCIPLRE